MITPEFVMQKLAEPFDARDVAKPLKDEPLTRPLYNEYMRDNRGPRNTPPRVQMQVGTPTLNQERMKQDISSFGERLGVNSMGGSALGQRMNEDLSVQHTKAADEEVADAKKTVRKITPATVNGVARGGSGRGGGGSGSTPLQQVGNAVTAAAPGVKRDRIADIGKKIKEGIGGLGITKEQVEAELAKRKPSPTKRDQAPATAQPTAAGNFKAGFSPTFNAVRNFNETMLGGVGKYITGPIGGTVAGTLAGVGNVLISNNDPTGPAYERWRNELSEYGNTPRARSYFDEAVSDPNFAATHKEYMKNNPGSTSGMSGWQYFKALNAGLR